MKITVIGAGYVGLVSGICFAKLGHEVICVEKDPPKLLALQNQQIPIYEPGLEELLLETVNSKTISFTSDISLATKNADAIFLAVGTPQDQNGNADLSYIFTAVAEIVSSAKNYTTIITKSTVPVGTGAQISQIIKTANPNLNFSIISNPEFLREGFAIEDFMNPDRIVIGCEDIKSQQIMAKIYEKLTDQGAKIIFTDIKTAELIKYAANSFLATKICFINEMADLCEKVGGNIEMLSKGIGLDSRIGKKFLTPGPGFGGSCFPKDIMALLHVANKKQANLSLISAVIASNDNRKFKMVKKIEDVLGGELLNKKIALLGLAFKANTDDIRYSPAIAIARELLQKGAIIKATDEQAIANSKKELAGFENITFYQDIYEAITDTDLIVIATEWNSYKMLNLAKIKKISKIFKIVDFRNILDKKKLAEAGFEYHYIGQHTFNQ